MRVSIVIPCFRQAHLLRGAVESALAQMHRDVEVIVVNDGSDDDTDGVARSFGDRIRYVSQRNGGLSSARNAGLAAATGSHCLFLDADDLLHPRSVEWLAAAAGTTTDTLCVMGYRTFIESPDETVFSGSTPAPDAKPFPHLIHDSFGAAHAYLVPAAALRAIGGFDPALHACEDWDCWVQLALAGVRLVTVQEVGAFYRNAPGSMSKDLRRMLVARTEVLLRTHRALVADAGRRSAYAMDLLRAEQRVLRRFYAQDVRETDLIRRVLDAMEELRSAGFRLPATRKERVLAAVFGSGSERVYTSLCRVFRRNWYDFYRSGFL